MYGAKSDTNHNGTFYLSPLGGWEREACLAGTWETEAQVEEMMALERQAAPNALPHIQNAIATARVIDMTTEMDLEALREADERADFEASRPSTRDEA